MNEPMKLEMAIVRFETRADRLVRLVEHGAPAFLVANTLEMVERACADLRQWFPEQVDPAEPSPPTPLHAHVERVVMRPALEFEP